MDQVEGGVLDVVQLLVDVKSVSRRCVDRQLLARCLSKERAEATTSTLFCIGCFSSILLSTGSLVINCVLGDRWADNNRRLQRLSRPEQHYAELRPTSAHAKPFWQSNFLTGGMICKSESVGDF